MTAIVVILGLMAIVWGAVFFRFAGLLPACLVTLLLGICFGSDFMKLSIVTLDRAFWGLTLGLFLFLRYHGQLGRVPWGRADFVATGFVSLLAISTFTHDWR